MPCGLQYGVRLMLGACFMAQAALPACKEGPGAFENEPTMASTAGGGVGPAGATTSATGAGNGNPNGAVSSSSTSSGNGSTNGNLPTAPTGVSETVHFVGRFVEDANSNKIFSWSGTQISAQFSGTGVSIMLDEMHSGASFGPNSYDVSIDGKAPTPIVATSGGGNYSLASGLAQGTHTVSVTKRTEASIGSARFRGFVVAGGALVAKPTSVSRRLLMIGDSITCGYGVLGTSSACSFSTATENVALTYGALAAAKFGADVQFTAWSGKGIYRNNDGSTGATMRDLFAMAEPADANTLYDWSQFVPDAIVINLGTNDFSASMGAPSQAPFTQAYLSMLTTLNQAYPKAHVFLVAGPMVIDDYPKGATYLTDYKQYLAAIAQAAPNASKTTVLELASLTDGQNGCDSHPNQSAQAIMAQSLEAALSAALGWQ